MEWLIKNVKILAMLLVASLVANAATTIWLLKTEKELTRVESTYGNHGVQGQNVLTLLNQMNQRLTRLEDIAERKERAERKGIAEQRKFFQAPQLPIGGEKQWGPNDVK